VVAIGPEHPMRVAGVEPLPVRSKPAAEVEDWLRIRPAIVLAEDDVGERAAMLAEVPLAWLSIFSIG
jgi:hypothetical protein